MDSSKTLYIYTRVSTSTQEEEGTSLENQTDLGIKKAKELGFDYKIFNEGGESSSHDDLLNRPVLLELLSKVEKGEIKHLFVYNTDRLSRNKITWPTIRFKLNNNGVNLYTSNSSFNSDSYTDDLLLGILSEISAYDNKLRTERSRLGKLNKIKQGNWLGGPPPFGYQIENKKLVINQEESKWVRFIFEQIVNQKTTREIKNLLLMNGVLTRRNNVVWSLGSIEKLITNTHYIGYYDVTDKKSGETVRCSCESIIPTDLFNKVLQIRERRRVQRLKEPNRKYFHLLKNFLVCGACGSKLSATKVQSTKREVYYCSSKSNNFKNEHTDRYITCKGSGFIKEKITDDLVWNTVVDVLTKSFQFKEETKHQIMGEKLSYSQSKRKLDDLLKKLKTHDSEINNYKRMKHEQMSTHSNLVSSFGYDKKEDERNKDIIYKIDLAISKEEEKKNLIILDINKIENSIGWIDWIKEHKSKLKNLKNLDLEGKHKILSKVVKNIIVRKIDNKTNELTINFQMPYVEDSFIWNDEMDKTKGYLVEKGKDSKKVVLYDEKKFQRK